jgi:hypothetical protein
MKKQIFIDGEYQYDYEKNGMIHTLSYPNIDFWGSHLRGETAFKIKDDGDGLSIQTPLKKNNIDYAEAEKLEILLRIINSGPVYEIGTKESL